MVGIAQQLFTERSGYCPWKQKHPRVQWPQIEALLAKKQFLYIDYALAECLLREYPHSTFEQALFICFLSKASREGHLSICVDGLSITPMPVDMDNFSLLLGAQTLPVGLVTEVEKNHDCKNKFLTPICRLGTYYYLQRNWKKKSLFFSLFNQLMEAPPTFFFEEAHIQDHLELLQKNHQLLEEQKHAIGCALNQTITLITGGPGTGKTYTAGKLINLYEKLLTDGQKSICNIILAAPTGKAAANLYAGVSAHISLPITSKTIHALLGIGSTHNSHRYKIDADLVIIDESSMLDLHMMCALLHALKPGTRLILLGDRYQLPAVESGTPFADLIFYSQNTPEATHLLCELKTCMRSELQSILLTAASINAGDGQKTRYLIEDLANPEVSRLCFPVDTLDIKKMRQTIVNYAMAAFPQEITSSEEAVLLLQKYQEFRMITPLRQGPYGCEEINAHCFKEDMKRQKDAEWLIVPIMIVHNSYRLELFNGMVGLLFLKRKHNRYEDYALFSDSKDPQGVRKISALLLPKYEYAYCISVHKSQGSEFDHVLVLLPEGSQEFGREVLYTAVTRARKSLKIWWASDDVLEKTIEKRQR